MLDRLAGRDDGRCLPRAAKNEVEVSSLMMMARGGKTENMQEQCAERGPCSGQERMFIRPLSSGRVDARTKEMLLVSGGRARQGITSYPLSSSWACCPGKLGEGRLVSMDEQQDYDTVGS